MAATGEDVVLHLNRQIEAQLLAAALLLKQTKKRREKREKNLLKQWGTHERRQKYGHFDNLMRELQDVDEAYFRNFTRLPYDLYQELITRVGPYIQRQKKKHSGDSHFRQVCVLPSPSDT